MIEYLKKDLSVNCRTTIMARLQEIYYLQKDSIKAKFSAISSKMSITCDVWTSKNQLSFLGVTIHFIDRNWKFCNMLIAFKYLEEEHDGLSICEALMDVFEEFEIASRILGITVDNASNNTTMFQEMEKIYNETTMFQEMEKYITNSTLMLGFLLCGTKLNALPILQANKFYRNSKIHWTRIIISQIQIPPT